jgi:hypothetical protein
LRIAWFTPVTGDDPVVQYSRAVLSAMTELCEPVLCCNAPPERFPSDVLVVNTAVATAPQGLTDLGSFDAVFCVLGNVLDQYVWIFERIRAHRGIVVLRDLTLHHFFLDYYLRHLRRPDLYVTRMAEHHGVDGLATAQLVLGPWLDTRDLRIEDQDLLRFTFFEEALRSASGAVVHCGRQAALVRKTWTGPICETRLPSEPPTLSPASAATQTAKEYVQDLLRYAEELGRNAELDRVAETECHAAAERVASMIGEILKSLGAKPSSRGVDSVIAEAARLVSPPRDEPAAAECPAGVARSGRERARAAPRR